jgi:hypothetical protein
VGGGEKTAIQIFALYNIFHNTRVLRKSVYACIQTKLYADWTRQTLVRWWCAILSWAVSWIL